MALGDGSFQREVGRAGAGSGGEGAHASAFQVHLIPPFLQTPGEGRVFVWRRGPWHTVNVGWSVPCSPLRWPPSPAHPAASVSALSAPCASRRAPLPAPAPPPPAHAPPGSAPPGFHRWRRRRRSSTRSKTIDAQAKGLKSPGNATPGPLLGPSGGFQKAPAPFPTARPLSALPHLPLSSARRPSSLRPRAAPHCTSLRPRTERLCLHACVRPAGFHAGAAVSRADALGSDCPGRASPVGLEVTLGERRSLGQITFLVCLRPQVRKKKIV